MLVTNVYIYIYICKHIYINIVYNVYTYVYIKIHIHIYIYRERDVENNGRWKFVQSWPAIVYLGSELFVVVGSGVFLRRFSKECF